MGKVIKTSSSTVGVLVVKGPSWHNGKTVTIYRLDDHRQKVQAIDTEVAEFRAGDNDSVYAAVFLDLTAGTYTVLYPGNREAGGNKEIAIVPVAVVEVLFAY